MYFTIYDTPGSNVNARCTTHNARQRTKKKNNKITLKKQNPQLAIGRRGYLDDNLISNIALYMVTVHKTLTL